MKGEQRSSLAHVGTNAFGPREVDYLTQEVLLVTFILDTAFRPVFRVI